ncbi:hypothetical protein [Vulcanococcus limneticus]|uniref:hypothetical protein n=1 Tax=Vulcanococcus limneticus TaxID=2170428 RepID=UPI00398C0FCA
MSEALEAISPPEAAPSKEDQLRQKIHAREAARGWRSFGGPTSYAWREWKLIAPGVRDTAFKTEAGGFAPVITSGTVSVNCSRLAWRQQGGAWINAGSPESTSDANAMVVALCAHLPSSARKAS